MMDSDVAAPSILVVEDDALVRMVLCDALADLGFRVEPTGSATEALERLGQLQGRVDAAILDVGLPDRTGDILAAELRASRADLPIVIATGYEDETLRAQFRGDPLVRFFGKPYVSADIAAELKLLGVRDPGGPTAAEA